jgi:ionotropic kainate glutamate receptor 2
MEYVQDAAGVFVMKLVFCLLCVQDIETFDLEDFKYNFVNMTAFRIVDAEDVGVREILKDMERFQPVGHSILNKSHVIQVRC